MPGILFTAGSYAEPAAKTFYTAGYLARKGPTGYNPAVKVPTVIRLSVVASSNMVYNL